MMDLPEGMKVYVYTVYEHPSDYPQEYVIRLHCICCGKVVPMVPLFASGPTLESVRARLPPHVINIGRHAEDDPVIKEVWL